MLFDRLINTFSRKYLLLPQVTDAVHAQGSYIYLQLWALGRAADPKVLKEEDPSLPYVSSSDVQLTNRSEPPRALTVEGTALPLTA